MRSVIWTDKNGYKHRALVRDEDPDSLAWEAGGVPQDPPDINQLNWEGIKRNLHNALVDAKLTTWLDVQRQKHGVTGAVHAAVRKPLLELYKLNRR